MTYCKCRESYFRAFDQKEYGKLVWPINKIYSIITRRRVCVCERRESIDEAIRIFVASDVVDSARQQRKVRHVRVCHFQYVVYPILISASSTGIELLLRMKRPYARGD